MTLGRILLVVDDPRIQRMLKSQLTQRGYDVYEKSDGNQAVHAAADDNYDLVLLDVSLPGIDGLEVCRQIREWSDVPIIILTGIDTPQAKMTALRQGADDCVTKPFHLGELEARIGAVMRRRRSAPVQPKAIAVGDMVIDLPKHEVRRGNKQVHLTKIEFGLLRELATHSDRTVTYEQLINAVWGGDNVDLRPLHVHMCNLRHKVQPRASAHPRILGVTGVGYRFRMSD